MSNQAWEQLSPIILWIGAETRVRCYVQVETLQSEVLSRKLHRYDRRTHDSQSTRGCARIESSIGSYSIRAYRTYERTCIPRYVRRYYCPTEVFGPPLHAGCRQAGRQAQQSSFALAALAAATPYGRTQPPVGHRTAPLPLLLATPAPAHIS
jgi:hypothetical protein